MDIESAKLLAERYNIIIDISDNYSSSNEYSFLKAVHEDAALIFQQNLFSDIGKEPLQYLVDLKKGQFMIGFVQE